MSENPLRQLQVHTQRALAAADQVDKQLETPASAAVVGCGRAFLAAIVALANEQRPAPIRAELPATPAEPPKEVETPTSEVISIGDEVVMGDGRRGVVQFEATSSTDGRVLYVEWAHGLVRCIAAACSKGRP